MYSRWIKRGTLGLATLGAGTFGASYYFFPDVRHDYNQLYLATSRVMRVGFAGARMAYIYAFKNTSMHEKHVQASKILYDCFLTNGGTYIKFGQTIASLDALAPDEYIEQMSNLYQGARESSMEDVRKQIEDTTGRKLEDIFSYFNPKPISAASVAQVHDAVLRSTGEKVAVKVQHRWLKEQCQGDLKIFSLLVDIGERLFPQFKYKWLAEEMSKIIPKELNFAHEAENAEKTRNFFKNNPNVRVPKIHYNYSSDRVMVMEFMEGVPINKIGEMRKMGINLKDVSILLTKCFSEMMFQNGFVHSDPHPGNLFITSKTNSKGEVEPVLILLDHGCYSELPESTRINYSYLWKGILTRNEEMIKEAGIKLGVGDLYKLLACMVSRKSYEDLIDETKQDYNERLRFVNTEEERQKLQRHVRHSAREITHVLHRINREVILLFKTQDFLATISNQLGEEIKKYEITAKYCFDAVEKVELKENPSFKKRLVFLFQRYSTLFGLKLYGLYQSFIHLFSKKPATAENQNELVLN